mgnify:CR=1 FL=1
MNKKDKSPRKRNAEATQARLLDAAEEQFTERGFDATRVDDVAEGAGVNKRMIYVYFGNKEALYLEVLRRAFQRAMDSAFASVSTEGDPVQITRSIIRWYFRYLAEHPRFVRLVTWEAMHHGRWSSQAIEPLAGTAMEKLGAVIQAGKEAGQFRADLDVRHLTVAVHGICLTFFSRRSLLETLWQEDLSNEAIQHRLLQSIEDLVFHGIGH